MRYISLFSGAGGLEAGEAEPILAVELDAQCRAVLARRFPSTELRGDVKTVDTPPAADVVTGGWPCQDLSVAGKRRGLEGSRSGLFFELIRVAVAARARTIVAENVPNLLRMDGGRVMHRVLHELHGVGFPHIAWRTLDAREFGLPHQRRRVFLVASKDKYVPRALHRPISPFEPSPSRFAAGFYTTAGLQSICYSEGYIPTLKVGSALGISSPPGLFFDGVVRKASATECLQLQGFDPGDFSDVPESARYGMAGNAVAVPVGKFVMDSVMPDQEIEPFVCGHSSIGTAGCSDRGNVVTVDTGPSIPLADNLGSYIDWDDREPLSERAAHGLLDRLTRSGKPCPSALWERLADIAGWDRKRQTPRQSDPDRETPQPALF